MHLWRWKTRLLVLSSIPCGLCSDFHDQTTTKTAFFAYTAATSDIVWYREIIWKARILSCLFRKPQNNFNVLTTIRNYMCMTRVSKCQNQNPIFNTQSTKRYLAFYQRLAMSRIDLYQDKKGLHWADLTYPERTWDEALHLQDSHSSQRRDISR